MTARNVTSLAVVVSMLAGLTAFGAPTTAAPTNAAPAEAPAKDAPPADKAGSPLHFGYKMPMDGFIAIDIRDKKSGKRVRRLVAEVKRAKGETDEIWDLKDDNGQFVPPGNYTYTAVARPPLKLTYQITVNNAGQPAWWAPPPGKGGGGWMADHTPPHAACAVGDTVFLGSQVAESGHAMIAVDLDGNKLWGQPLVFGGFLGARCFAGDDRYAYIVNGAGVMRVDPKEKFAQKQLHLNVTYSRDLPGPDSGEGENLGGAAIRGDKFYLSYNSPTPAWVQSTFTPDQVDLDRSVPQIRMSRPSRQDYPEYDYDEVQMFHGAVNDGAEPSSTQAYFGDAPPAGELRGSLTIAFKKPVAVGSVLIPDRNVEVYALKPGQTLNDTGPPTDPDAAIDTSLGAFPFNEAQWIRIKTEGKMGVLATADKTLATTALRFKATRLPFVMAMSHRMRDVAPEADRVMVDGTATGGGGWAVARPADDPINPDNPAIMALVWKNAVALHGLSLINPTQAILAIDVWTGPDNIDPRTKLSDDQYWTQKSKVMTEDYGPFPQTATVRNADFGGDVNTRAVRIRAIEPPGWAGGFNTTGNTVTGIHHAGFDSVVAYAQLPDSDDGAPDLSQRITEFAIKDGDTLSGDVTRQIPIAQPGSIAFSPDGTLYAVSAGQVVTVPLDGAKPRVVVARDALISPAGIAFDKAGELFVADTDAHVVKVFDVKTAKLVRIVGKTGPRALGPWDEERLDCPSGIAIDSAGKLWVAEPSFQPKRISTWSPDGKLVKSFLGPAVYGGGGTLDEGDHSILNFNGMEFKIDWPSHTWKLANLLYRPGTGKSLDTTMPDRAVYHDGHRFLVGDEKGGGTTLLGVICVERNGIAVPVVAAGNLGKWSDVDRLPALRARFSKLNRGEYGFVWVDKNGDATPQVDEIQITHENPMADTYWASRVGDNLSLNFNGARLRPTGFDANGMPDYDIHKLEILPQLNESWTTADGRTFAVAQGGSGFDRMLAPDGKTVLWDYPDKYSGVQGSHNTTYDRPPGELVGEFSAVGHFKVGGEELFVTNANHGDWFAFTSDGLLAACIFGGPGDKGYRSWTMPEWNPGVTDLSGLRLYEEHFFGDIVKAEDDHVYAVAGHNHSSVVRVDGLEQMKRLNGDLPVTAADIQKASVWDVQQAAIANAKQGPKLGHIPYVPHPLQINGDPGSFPEAIMLPIHLTWNEIKRKFEVDTEAGLAYDSDKLYIAASINDDSPAMNGAADLPTLYESGDALDISLGLDPKADPARTAPAQGDVRILITRIKGKPEVELYRYAVPGTPAEKVVHFSSGIADTAVDSVSTITDANVAIKTLPHSWTVEAAIPWKDLGVHSPPPGTHLRGDVGVLVGDQNGVRTVGRYYWSGKSQTVVSDLAMEARLAPSLWGDLVTQDTDASLDFGPGEVDVDAGP